MSTATPKPCRLEVDLPAEAFDATPWDPAAIAAELRVLWLIELVRTRRLAHSKAAQLAGMSREAFIVAMGARGVSPFDYDPDELAEELAS